MAVDSIRHAARGFLRRPSYLVTLVVLLGVGSGVTTAAFAIYDAVLLRPLPYSRADRLFVLSEARRATGSVTPDTASATAYLYWREHATTLAGIAAVWSLPRGMFTTIEGRSEVLNRATASPDTFAVLGAGPALGTTSAGFVISAAYWRRRFDSDPAALGKLVVVEGGRGLAPVPIVGVMAADVNIPPGVDLWSVGREPEVPTTSGRRAERRLVVIARLRPGFSERQMRSELETLESQLAASYPDTHAGWSVRVTDLRTYLAGPSRRTAAALQLTAVFVLVVIFINSAILMLAHAESLARADLLRVALGATRRHLSSSVAADWFVVGAATAAVGMGVATVTSRLLARQAELYLPFVDRAAIDAHATSYLVLLVAIVCATLAVLELTHRYRAASSCRDLRRQMGTSVLSKRSMSALLVVEVSLGVLLVGGAIRLGVHVRALSDAISTVDPSGVVAVRVRQPIVWSGDTDNSYPTGRFVATNTALLRAVERTPGIASVATVSTPPFAGSANLTLHYSLGPATANSESPGQDADRPAAVGRTISPNYFRTLGIPLLAGRDFVDADLLAGGTAASAERTRRGVAIVSRGFVERHWPGESAVGRTISLGDDSESESVEIVGIVGDVVHSLVNSDPTIPTIYVPYSQNPSDGAFVLAKTVGAGASEAAIRRALGTLGDRVAVLDVRSYDNIVAAASAPARFTARTASTFAIVALAIAALGMFSVVSLITAKRRTELAVRVALGATSRRILWTVLRRTAWISVLGLSAGGLLAALSEAWVAQLAPSVPGTGASSVFEASVVVGGAVMLAALWPAVRASLADPNATLRSGR